jgi:hypothetical protein
VASVTIKYLKKILYSFFSLQLLNNCPMQNVFFEYLFPQLWHHHNHIIVKRFYACDFRTTSICDMWCGLWLGASWLTSSPEPPPWLRYPRRKLKFQWSFIKPRIPIYVGGRAFMLLKKINVQREITLTQKLENMLKIERYWKFTFRYCVVICNIYNEL